MYLSHKNSMSAKKLSQDLLDLNGWEIEFTTAKKFLNHYSAIIDDYNVNGIGFSKMQYELIRAIVNVLVVSYHLINHLNIRHHDMMRVGFTGYTIDGNTHMAKIPRVYNRILKTDFKPIGGKINMTRELDIAAEKVIQTYIKKFDNLKTAMQFQLCIASEEAIELSKEISKYYRLALTRQNDELGAIRDNIIEELFDTLYCIRYVMICDGISSADINNFARMHIHHIWASHVADKMRSKIK